MSAKLTILFFILICFEIGILLTVLPWLSYPSWNENYLLFLLADKLHLAGLSRMLTSGYARGAVTGLGLLNLWIGILEIANFNKTVRFFQTELQGKELEPAAYPTPAVSDHRPPENLAPKE
ncbi:MAG: hypothetical protein HY231_10755 [Acidobacteria bacterium]|nr:hypothetical protein [Acidobacteriota bacterium]